MLAWVDEQLAALSLVVGFPSDQLAMVLCLLLNYPLGFLFLRLLGQSDPAFRSSSSSLALALALALALRHVYSVVPSVLFGVWLFQWDILHSLVSSMVGYAILLATSRSTSCGKIMFIYAMAYVAASHIYSMYYSYMDWHLDFTRPQMIITIKLTTLAFNLSDAKHRVEEELSAHEKEKQVKEMPSVLEFLGYIYFFPSFLAGPHIYFADYKRFIEGTLYPKGEAPSTVMPTITKIGQAVLCLAVTAPLSGMMPIPWMCTDDYYTHGFVFKFLYMWVSLLAARFSFYFAWLLSEGSFIACGIGYNGKVKNASTGKEEIKWDRFNNVDVLGWELHGQSPRVCVASWNRQVQQWLYNYVYVRSFYTVEVFDEKTQKKIKISKRAWYSTLLTNMLSAFWHGFYPGYYLGFASMAFVIEAARILRAVLRHRFLLKAEPAAVEKTDAADEDSPMGKAKEAKPAKGETTKPAAASTERPSALKPLYDVASWVLTQTSISFCMFPFLVLEFSCSIRAWNSLGWWAHIGCAVLLLAQSQGLLRPYEERRKPATTTASEKTAKAKAH
jgi:lysophospholipid acyltransferase